jgi:hypothetical protein
MTARTLLLTCLAMLAFAGNSVLCRLALKATEIDAASFTSLRLLSGALMLWLLVRLRQPQRPAGGTWPAALALFSYAAAFSFAYIKLDAGTGALLLFGAVQLSMLSWQPSHFVIDQSAPGDIRRSERNKKPPQQPAQSKCLYSIPFILSFQMKCSSPSSLPAISPQAPYSSPPVSSLLASLAPMISKNMCLRAPHL